MREIKFRAWNPKGLREMGKGMIYSDDFCDMDSFFCLAYGQCGQEKNEITQYTGLKDRNGKEIYEGDVVNDGLITGPIVFKNCGYYIDLGLPVGVCPLTEQENIEIIGNVYENPDLIIN